MGQKIDCEIVRDLLPNYIEHMTGRATNESIEEHLEGCTKCKEIYLEMREEIQVETAPEVKNFKKYLGWTQLRYITGGAGRPWLHWHYRVYDRKFRHRRNIYLVADCSRKRSICIGLRVCIS